MKHKLKKIINTINRRLIKFSNWTNKCSSVKQSSLKLGTWRSLVWNTFIITLFCFSFTYCYYDWFGINYFLHLDYTDIYNFTISRLSVFFSSTLFISFLLIVFLGFFVTKNECKKNFSNLQLWILRIYLIIPLLFTLGFVYSYSNSLKNVFATLGMIAILLFSFYMQNKVKHYLFLIVFIIIFTSIGMVLGKVFAEERYITSKYINLIDSSKNKNILSKSQLVIGQNKDSYIIINKKDTICEFIPKSSNIKISFKGNIKAK